MIKQALILAGGKGTRMDPLGDYLPKCLATVYNRPLIDYQIRLLETAGVEDIYVCVSALHHRVVEESLKCLSERRVFLLKEEKPAGLNALFSAGLQLEAKPFWLMLGDIYYGADSFLPAKMPQLSQVELFTRAYVDPHKLARETSNVVVQGSRVTAVLDKPEPAMIQGDLGWYATALIAPDFLRRQQDIVRWLKENRTHAHVGDIFHAAVELGIEVTAAQGPAGDWINVNTPEQLLQASLREAEKYRSGSKRVSGSQ